ncbi:BgTH12-04807 [Blumeria graminis f. sp. triticale]|uniref:BgTH12-04807 n=1 Tax=Blumeria graminis f. sp. triticale TaxID=1689686 RepID=A0A9W4D0P3_BLUGR|nr:BgTH12-04807 [Blumeria graminis f. sp. triticale]
MSSISSVTYSASETDEVNRWLAISEKLKVSSENDRKSILENINTHLASRTTFLGSKPSKADITFYHSLAPLVSSWSPEQKTGENGNPNIVRHLDFVQNSPIFELLISDTEKVTIDPEKIMYVKPMADPKAEKERLKKEKAAAIAKTESASETTMNTAVVTKNPPAKNVIENIEATTTGETAQSDKKKNKKEKAPKLPKLPAVAASLSPCLIDLRVGHILKAIKHPEAETLYVSTIAMGDKPGTDDTSEYEGQIVRTVCSGLNGLVPLEEMQGRKVIVVCNLKPVKMRGIKSSAMVLAASPRLKEGEDDHHGGPVELVSPPVDAVAGERVFFEGWKGEPEGILNPKKKIWENIQPGFTTTGKLEVVFDAGAVKALQKEGEPLQTSVGKLVTESGGICKVRSLADAIVR